MRTAAAARRKERLPGLLPILYFGLAHLSLAFAFGAVAIEPQKVSGFFYHPRMIAVVHLVTLGWISGSILGALHLVGPMALRTPMPARLIDYLAFGCFAFGSFGIVSHFWIEEFSGVAWSGLLVTLAFAHVGHKLLAPLLQAPRLQAPRLQASLPGSVLIHFLFAFGNIGLAAVMGTLLGLNKHITFFPGRALTHAYAHAHLAAIGWATMMVFAAGYRLLPMLLPAAMPTGRWVWASAVLLELGALGLFAGFFVQSRWLVLGALLAAAGVAIFLGWLGWMTRHPRRPPKDLIRPDFGVAQAGVALVYLGLTGILGLILAFAPTTTEWTLRLAMVYGVFGLLGFLSQLIVGVSARLFPIFGRLLAAEWDPYPPSPHAMPDRRLQATTFSLWLLGVPLLAVGFFVDRVWMVGTAGWILLAAVASGVAGHAKVWRAARAGLAAPGDAAQSRE